MPWENDAVPSFAPAPAEPSIVDVLGAAFARENLIGSAIVAARTPRPDAAPDPSFDPWAAIEGTKYEAHAPLFVNTNSAEDVQRITDRIDQEEERARLLNSTTGMIASLAAGVLDPVNLIPIGGSAYRVGRSVTALPRVLEGAARLGAGAAAGQAIQETGLQATQLTRGLDESAMNIAGAAVIGGVLGGAVGALTRPLDEIGAGAAHGSAIFDREVAANLPGERPPVGPGTPLDSNASLEALAERHGALAGATPTETAAGIVERIGPDGAAAEAARLAGEHDTLMRDAETKGVIDATRPEEVTARAAEGDAGDAGLRAVTGDAGADAASLRDGGRGLEAGRREPAGDGEPAAGLAAPTQGGSIGAAKVLDTSLDQETVASALGVEKALVQGSPTLRTGTSPLIDTRQIANELADQPLVLKKNIEFIPTAQSVEGLIKQYQAPLAEAMVNADDAFTRYRLGRAKQFGDITRIETRDLFGRPAGTMSYSEFREQVSRAMRRNDASDIPEVAAAAKMYREKVFDPLKERAIEAGLLPEDVDVKTADSYLMRVYNAQKIIAQRGQFSDVITRWLGDEQAKKDVIRSKVADLLEEHRDLTERVQKREAQIAGREQTLRDTEMRQQEVSRLNAFAYRRATKLSEPVDKLRTDINQIHAEISPQLQRLEELRTAIAAEREKFPEFKEIDAAMYRLIGASGKLKEGAELVDLVRGGEDVTKAIEDVRASVRGGIRGAAEERILARLGLGAGELVALEKTRAKLSKTISPYRKQLRELERKLEREMRARGGPARGGAVFETAIRNRGNTLADQASGRAAAIEGIGGRLENDQARLAAIRSELEEHVKNWEGKNSKAAKAALARRAEKEAERTPEQKRLAEADAPVFDAAKAISNTNTRLEEIELRDISRQIIDRILGSPVGRLPYDMEVPHPSGGPPRPDRAAPRGPLAERAFMIPDAMIEDWLESDVQQIARSYTRTMAPDVLLAERFGRTDMQSQFQQIQAGYERLRQGKSEAEQKRLHASMSADLRDLAAMRDRLRGTYGLPADPNSLGNRAYHVVRDLNYLRLLGGMTISALPDMGRLVMTHGLTRTFGDAIVPMLKDFQQFRMAAREAKLAGVALDMVLDTRAMSMADMLDDYGRWSKAERGLKGLTEKFGLVTLMAPWNSAMKQIAGVLGQTRSLQAIEALVAGRRITQAEQTRLASLGIGSDMAARIDAEFQAHGVKQDNGTWWANTETWTDRRAIEAFRSALNKEIDTVIVTRGQEVPLWMSKGVGRMIGQFHSFNMASVQRVMMSGLQQRDMAALNGAVLMAGLGMLSFAIQSSINPKAQPLPDPTTPGGLARWLREGVDKAGLTGYLFDIHNIVEKVTGGGIGLSRLTGGPMQSRYANRNALESILGPTAGLFQDFVQMGGNAAKGQWTAGDSSRLRRMIILQNTIGFRHLFDAAEHGINRFFGIREPAPHRR